MLKKLQFCSCVWFLCDIVSFVCPFFFLLTNLISKIPLLELCLVKISIPEKVPQWEVWLVQVLIQKKSSSRTFILLSYTNTVFVAPAFFCFLFNQLNIYKKSPQLKQNISEKVFINDEYFCENKGIHQLRHRHFNFWV